MIRSMTGFGESAATEDGVHYVVEVRSLNSRYFKSVIRMPDELQLLEAEIEQVLRNRLRRGSVFCTVKYADTSARAAYSINSAALALYVDALKKARDVLGSSASLDLGPLLSLPGVLQPPQDVEERAERARGALLRLLNAACDHVLSMRKREGEMIREDLLNNRKLIVEKLKIVKGRLPVVMGEYENRLRNRIESMLSEAGISSEPADLIREIAIAAEKSDVAEELTRLEAHTDQFEDLVLRNDGEPVGRTLDFLTQEMLREANTIASKSSDAQVAREIVEVKGAIDRIKEQVQNVE